MKYIVKNTEPIEFTNWKNQANQNWSPTYASMPGDIKSFIKKSLLQEQGYICCYCEREIDDTNSHIEHFDPQERGVVDPLLYDNILCSCQKNLKKGDPRHCGNAKENWFDSNLLVSPLNATCEQQFSYSYNGKIGSELKAGKETIENLKLNISKLNVLRKETIDLIIDDQLSENEFKAFIQSYLTKQNGKFQPFYTMIKQLFG